MSYNAGLPVKFYGVSHVTATLSSRHPQLGAETYDADGNKYVWVYNAANSTIPKTYGCVIQSGVSTAYSVTLSSAVEADKLVGLVKHSDIATGCYGFVMTRGVGIVEMATSSGSVATNGVLTLADNGAFGPKSGTVGEPCGKALAAIVSSASGSAYISVY